ncbi:hypothetical protein EYR40_009089 [Pleurotus pulmonarius]|nr:hypothetical protein EYR40_009089 [Pleurotus pulmonarius]
MSTTSRVISTIPLISNTSSTAPLPTPITTFVLSSSSPTSPIHSPSTSSSTPTPSVLSEDDDNSLARNTGAIIGISIASFAALLGLVFFIFLFARTRRRRNTPYPNERTSSGRMSALRNLLGASPSIGRGTTTSSFGSNTSHSGFGHGYTGSTDSNLPEARHVMSTTGGAGISLSSQLSLDRFVDHSNDRLSLSGDVDGKGSMGVGVAAAGDALTGHATNGVPAALIRSGGSSSRISGIGVALTTDEYPAFSPILPSSATTALLAKSGLNRSTSGRSPILYRPTPPQALSPPSSYHWAAASTQSPSTPNTINNGPRASPDHSIESVTSPSPEATPYHTMASSSGHGHGLSNSSDQHSETSSNSAKGKFRGAPTFAVGLVNFGKGRSGNSSNKSSSSDVTSTFMDVKRSSIKPKGKDKDVDFGFLGRLKSGNGNKAKRGSSSSFGRPGKDPVRVGTRVSGMSFTTYALDGDRGADQVDEHGSRLRPSSLLNPPNRLSGSGPSPVDSSFPYQTVVSPPVAYSSSINMHSPSSSQHHYVPSATNRMEDGSASQTNEPSGTLEPLSDAARPTSLIVSGSSTLPTVRSKRGRSQLYISNDTRWAESVADSFYGSGSSDDHDQTRTAQAPVQEITLPDTFDAQQHSPYSAVSHYSQPSAAPSVVGHANTANEMTQASTPLSINPFARPPQAFTHSQSPSGDRTSYASNGSNVTDSSMNSYNTRPGVPEGLLRPDLRTFVLGLRTRDGGQHLSNVPEDAYVNAIGEPGGEEWRRRESDGVSVGSLRDHVDYSRPIGASILVDEQPDAEYYNI